MPIPIRIYVPEDLFAGKMHALLCRAWKNRVKGRDWYDFIWFVRKDIPLNLSHLESRLQQSGHLEKDRELTKALLLDQLRQKIETLNIPQARADIQMFVADQSLLACWSKEYFLAFASKIQFAVNVG
jgi:hypothetical protein